VKGSQIPHTADCSKMASTTAQLPRRYTTQEGLETIYGDKL
jgi:hypothetical protein